ncbi:MAG: hypothetical protein LAT68_00040 [Cyclobacteriaceae bacterium]|nr:hypothetical protein [Cyclobacteriaceae bacterium]MCH8514690.1 hypothetical protein [Cyclobacteriaceae bacterium]
MRSTQTGKFSLFRTSIGKIQALLIFRLWLGGMNIPNMLEWGRFHHFTQGFLAIGGGVFGVRNWQLGTNFNRSMTCPEFSGKLDLIPEPTISYISC